MSTETNTTLRVAGSYYRRWLILPIVAVAVTAAQPASADCIVGYDLTMFGDPNVPHFTLENLSDSVAIDAFNITIGDTSRNFDYTDVQSSSSGIASTANSPDIINDGVRADFVNYTFSGFSPSDFVELEADIDTDPTSNAYNEYYHVMFDLDGSDSSDNSLVTVSFSDGTILSGLLPDFATPPPASAGTFVFSQSLNACAVPLPPSFVLLLIGTVSLAGYGGWRRHRETRRAVQAV